MDGVFSAALEGKERERERRKTGKHEKTHLLFPLMPFYFPPFFLCLDHFHE